jgi:serine phosphatase RsbU (regulator of sigma subunit)
MQRHVNQHDQARFVRALSSEFDGLARHGRFATAVAFTYDAPPNRLLVCNAGHPPPLIWRGRLQAWSLLEPAVPELGNVPLGIEADVEYEEFAASIEFGDVVICYTDALIEARRGSPGPAESNSAEGNSAGGGPAGGSAAAENVPTGQMLGEEGLLHLVRDLDPRDGTTLIPRLIAAVTAAKFAFDDDLTILIFRPNGARQTIPLRDRLLAPVRFARALAHGHVALP